MMASRPQRIHPADQLHSRSPHRCSRMRIPCYYVKRRHRLAYGGSPVRLTPEQFTQEGCTGHRLGALPSSVPGRLGLGSVPGLAGPFSRFGDDFQRRHRASDSSLVRSEDWSPERRSSGPVGKAVRSAGRLGCHEAKMASRRFSIASSSAASPPAVGACGGNVH